MDTRSGSGAFADLVGDVGRSQLRQDAVGQRRSAFLCRGARCAVEISEAALFRGIEKWQPTIIVDEADVLLVDNEPLRAVVNSGWTRGSCVLRCIGDDNTPHAFPTFCPKVIGMKGRKLPDTTLSRSIIIEMKRKKTSETVVHFRSIDDAGLAELRRRALRWANDNGEKLGWCRARHAARLR